MNMNIRVILSITAFFVVVCCFPVQAQNILVGLGGGGAAFSMNSAKTYNQEVAELLSFTPKLTDNFPSYYYYKAEVLYSFGKIIAAGINVYTTSTGSRLTLSDYSGKYRFDNRQKGIFPGIKLLFGKAPALANGLCFALEGGLAVSSMTFDEDLSVFEESQTYTQDFKSFGYFVQPGIYYYHQIIPNVQLAVNASYYLGMEKGYHIPGEKDQVIRSSKTNKEIKPEWDGCRAGVTVYWNFSLQTTGK
jgi:hypothetical protein